MEAATAEEPRDGFLHQVQQLCEENGALFILDEIITGFRWHLGGAQKCYGVKPDLATFGKAIANGFALSALAGRREVMRLGGLDHDREKVFLLSTTHGAETHALAAAREVLRVYQRLNVVEVLYRQGERLRSGVKQVISTLGLNGYFEVLGRPCNLIFTSKDQTGARSQPFRTLFLQEIIKRGVIGPSFVISFAHSDEDVDRTIDAVYGALQVYRKALDEGVEKYLVGRAVKPAMRRFN
jgi:glutamate-1-semialdehyde 2,1-aminomutase